MTYPTKAQIQANYTALATALGDGSLPGSQMDTDYRGLRDRMNELNDFVRGITRADGALANQSVRRETLASDVLIGFDAPTTWEAGHVYEASNTVFRDNVFYIANVAHTSSGSFGSDLAAGYWDLLADLTPPDLEVQWEWQAGKEYAVDAAAFVGDTLYICISAHTASAEFATDLAANRWQLANTSPDAAPFLWQAGKSYTADTDVVFVDDDLYVARTNHTASGSFSNDLAASKWWLLTVATVPRTVEITYKVPTDFPTVLDAIRGVRNRVAGHTRVKINVMIETGHALTQGVKLENGDYSNINITYEGDSGVPGTAAVSMAPGWTGFTDADLGIPANDKAGNLFLFFNCIPPVLACKIDMGGTGANGWYPAWGCPSSTVLPGCGVINAGYNGFEARGGAHTLHDTVWDGAKNSGIRIAYSGNAAAQSATADNCCVTPDTATVGAVECSRGASLHFRAGSAKNSGAAGANIRRAGRVVIEEADFSDATGTGILIQHAAVVSGYSVVADDCGQYGLWVRSGKVQVTGGHFTGNATSDIRIGDSSPTSSGADVDVTDVTTTAGTTEAQVLSNISGAADLNVPTRYGIAWHQGVADKFHMGIYSATGATDGKTFDPDTGAVLRSSRTGTSSQTHQSFANANGVVGSVTTSGSATAFNTSSDALKKILLGDFEGALGVLQSVPVRLGRFKTEPEGAERAMMTAQEIRAVAPDAVVEGEDGFLMVDFTKLIPLMWAAILELARRNDG